MAAADRDCPSRTTSADCDASTDAVCSGTCDGACVDLFSDSSHCGACDRACSGAQTCRGGVCVIACTAISDCATDDPCLSFNCLDGRCTYGSAECGQISPDNTCCPNVATGEVTCCGAGEACQEGTCQAACGGGCGDGQTCRDGHCVTTCASDGDCVGSNACEIGSCQADGTCFFSQPDPCFICETDDECINVFRQFDPTTDFDGVCCQGRCFPACAAGEDYDEHCTCVAASAPPASTASDGGSTNGGDTTGEGSSGEVPAVPTAGTSGSPSLTLPDTGSGQAAARGGGTWLAPFALLGAAAAIAAGRRKRAVG